MERMFRFEREDTGSTPVENTKKIIQRWVVFFYVPTYLFIMILTEGKLDDLKKKYSKEDYTLEGNRLVDDNLINSENVNDDIIGYLYESDPSKTKKYVDWMVKQIFVEKKPFYLSNENIDGFVNLVKKFDEKISKIDDDFLLYNIDLRDSFPKDKPVKDINSYDYKLLVKIIPFLVEYRSASERKKEAKDGAIKVYEDNLYRIYKITTFEASCWYGRGSKWCTTQSASHFRSYGTGLGELLYCISKTKTIDDDSKFYKIAINIKYSNPSVTFYDAIDHTFNGWKYFEGEDKKVIDFLVKHIELSSGGVNIDDFLPLSVRIERLKNERNLSDLEIFKELKPADATKWFVDKYSVSNRIALDKKITYIIENGLQLNQYLSDEEITEYYINIDDFSNKIYWTEFFTNYNDLYENFLFIKFTSVLHIFFNDDPKEMFRILNKVRYKKTPLFYEWFINNGASENRHSILGYVFNGNTNKFISYIRKVNPNFDLLRYFGSSFTNITDYRIFLEGIYRNDPNEDSLIDFILRYMTLDNLAASFGGDNKSGWRKTYIYISKCGEEPMTYIPDDKINKLFDSKEKFIDFLVTNPTNFEERFECLMKLSEGSYEESAEYVYNFFSQKYGFKKLEELIGSEKLLIIYSLSGNNLGVKEILEKENHFNDIEFDGNLVILNIGDDRTVLSVMFKDDDLAKSLLGEDLDWEPYSDVIYDWSDQVWDSLSEKGKEYVKDRIKKEIDYFENEDGDNISISDEFFNNITDEDLGDLIEGNDAFEEIKDETGWWYSDCYNNLAQGEIINRVYKDIENEIGKDLNYITKTIKKSYYDENEGIHKTRDVTIYEWRYELDDFYGILREWIKSNIYHYEVDFHSYFINIFLEIWKDNNNGIYIDTDRSPYFSGKEMGECMDNNY